MASSKFDDELCLAALVEMEHDQASLDRLLAGVSEPADLVERREALREKVRTLHETMTRLAEERRRLFADMEAINGELQRLNLDRDRFYCDSVRPAKS